MSAFTIPTIFTATDKISSTVSAIQGRLSHLADGAKDVAMKSALVGGAIAAPLALMAHSAIQFEDRMADVAKTTGLTGKALTEFSGELLKMAPDTRTSIESLQSIAAIGGQMGVAQNELLGFTDSVNKFNVALGSDFGGGVEEATRAVSGLKGLFKETRDVNIADAITKTGSAINALSAKGVLVPELTEFTNRLGALPDAVKPSIQSSLALAAVFNKSGVSAEIAARGFGDIVLTAAQNIPAFAKQMRIGVAEASKLINTRPEEFASRFAASLKGLSTEKLSLLLKNLKIGDTGAIKVIGSLAAAMEKQADGTTLLSQFQKIANEEFAKGTSLLNEYNTKNETVAAKIERMKNTVQALTIELGSQLLPVIGEVLKSVTPVIKDFLTWTQKNSGLVKTILWVASGIAALSFAISGISSVIFIVTKAQMAWNAIMLLNPIGLIIVGITALIALITAIVAKWNDWGAAVSLFLGPIGMVISIIQSFRRNWDMVVEAFSKGGILEGIKAIGKVLLDAVLMPVQQLMGIVSKLTGWDWASKAVSGIESFRKALGVNITTDENGNNLAQATHSVEMHAAGQGAKYYDSMLANAITTDESGNPESGNPARAINPKAELQRMYLETSAIKQYNSTVTFENVPDFASIKTDDPFAAIKPKFTSTTKWTN